MPIVKKSARYVKVAYELCCGFERSIVLAKLLEEKLKTDPGFHTAKDDTRGWDGDRLSVVVVTYTSLQAANELDSEVRHILSQNVDFTFEFGPNGLDDIRTTCQVRE